MLHMYVCMYICSAYVGYVHTMAALQLAEQVRIEVVKEKTRERERERDRERSAEQTTIEHFRCIQLKM